MCKILGLREPSHSKAYGMRILACLITSTASPTGDFVQQERVIGRKNKLSRIREARREPRQPEIRAGSERVPRIPLVHASSTLILTPRVTYPKPQTAILHQIFPLFLVFLSLYSISPVSPNVLEAVECLSQLQAMKHHRSSPHHPPRWTTEAPRGCSRNPCPERRQPQTRDYSQRTMRR